MGDSKWNREGIAFSAQGLGEIVELKFTSNPMLKLTDLQAKVELLDYLDMLCMNPDIRVVILHSNPEKSGREEYKTFYQNLLKSRVNRDALCRMYNAVNQFILKILELNQVTIHINSGEVIMMFLNMSLACDYRIVADNIVFQNPCHELGMIPKGGGAYFLSRRLGHAKAFEIMASCRDIQADEALALGLVNEVVPVEDLESRALEVAQLYIKNPSRSLVGIKRLLNFCMKDIREYLDFENREIMRIVDSGMMQN
jgi:2-(1,2-epoxy-1,2-dihydrophenyl)acetyl-CoA isomerase